MRKVTCSLALGIAGAAGLGAGASGAGLVVADLNAASAASRVLLGPRVLNGGLAIIYLLRSRRRAR
ncbi:hypothetical protein, partial [Stenotrophomonas maltophilia]|uniref:hypothetical protein n=1 Tax=Stenotrophomonas maltophilia TaxID=40324 RepID=UPI001EF78DB9